MTESELKEKLKEAKQWVKPLVEQNAEALIAAYQKGFEDAICMMEESMPTLIHMHNIFLNEGDDLQH